MTIEQAIAADQELVAGRLQRHRLWEAEQAVHPDNYAVVSRRSRNLGYGWATNQPVHTQRGMGYLPVGALTVPRSPTVTGTIRQCRAESERVYRGHSGHNYRERLFVGGRAIEAARTDEMGVQYGWDAARLVWSLLDDDFAPTAVEVRLAPLVPRPPPKPKSSNSPEGAASLTAKPQGAPNRPANPSAAERYEASHWSWDEPDRADPDWPAYAAACGLPR